MKDHPILFTASNVRAILEDRKTQTRRVCKPQPSAGVRNSVFVRSGLEDGHGRELRCPYGQPGDRLWVRETFGYEFDSPLGTNAPPSRVLYRADAKNSGKVGWSPSIHMPRWASRITLEITDVRVERVQGISEEDAIAEGCDAAQGLRGDDDLMVHVIQGVRGFGSSFPVARFVLLWDSINGKRGFNWNANPYVWVITFKRVTP